MLMGKSILMIMVMIMLWCWLRYILFHDDIISSEFFSLLFLYFFSFLSSTFSLLYHLFSSPSSSFISTCYIFFPLSSCQMSWWNWLAPSGRDSNLKIILLLYIIHFHHQFSTSKFYHPISMSKLYWIQCNEVAYH